jgi:hypothetical protein
LGWSGFYKKNIWLEGWRFHFTFGWRDRMIEFLDPSTSGLWVLLVRSSSSSSFCSCHSPPAAHPRHRGWLRSVTPPRCRRSGPPPQSVVVLSLGSAPQPSTRTPTPGWPHRQPQDLYPLGPPCHRCSDLLPGFAPPLRRLRRDP